MVCWSGKKQWMQSCLVLMACFALSGIPEPVWAQLSPNGISAGQSLSQVLAITELKTSPLGLKLTANRALTTGERERIRILRLPSPDRLVIDVPNARMDIVQTEFPIYQNGIQKVMLSSSDSATYHSSRITVVVDNPSVLMGIKPVFNQDELNLVVKSALINTPQVSTGSFLKNGVAEPGFKVAEPGLKKISMDTSVANNAPKKLPQNLSGQSSFGHQTVVKPTQTATTPFAKPLGPINTFTATMEKLARKILPVTPATLDTPKESSASSANNTPARTTENILGHPVAEQTSILQHASLENNALNLEGLPGDRLHIKKRFTLSNPSRLVVDIENTVLRSKEMTQPFFTRSATIKQVRLGQFDDSTVRIVIETDTPEQFEPVYVGNKTHTLSLTPHQNSSVGRLSAQSQPGEVESIDLKKENGKTVLRIEASTVIVHRLMKQNGRLQLDLLNEASRPTTIGFDSQKFPEIRRMRLSQLSTSEPSSKFTIYLADSSTMVETKISPDGKVIELSLDDPTPYSSSSWSSAANRPPETPSSATSFGNLAALSNGKAPFPARIVIDAGHGGKDNGASRGGANEKDLNLSLALLLRDTLTNRGFKVYMTRSEDIFLPLPKITEITNSIKPDLFISIHHNASTNSAMNGIETYYYTPQSIPLANRVHTQSIRLVGAKNGNVKQARFYVIHHTSVPAILCEVGYVSNPQELEELQGMQRKRKTAEAIANGVVEYLQTRLAAQAR